MAINSKYETLIKFAIQYQDGNGSATPVLTNIKLVPTINTRKIFRQGHLLFKSLKKGSILFFRVTDNVRTPFVQLDQGTLLTFIIHLENKNEFIKITDLGADYDRKKIILYKNSMSPSTQNIEHINARAPVTRLFNYDFEVSGNPATANLKIENTLLEFNNLPNLNNKFIQQLDMRNFENGKYKMLITSPPQEEEIYVDDDLAAGGIIGLVEIDLPSSAYPTTHEYNLIFKDKP